MLKVRATTLDACRLLQDGALALSRVEEAGMRIDVERLEGTMDSAKLKIQSLTSELKGFDEYRTWKNRFGEKTNIGSRHQLGVVLFDMLGHDPTYNKEDMGKRAAERRKLVDEDALMKVDTPFVRKYLAVERLKKLKGTYLSGIRREVVGEYLHPSFALNLTRTRRSSSSMPNFQNIPIRDPKMGKPIRSCFIPRDGHVIVEVDYSALEFRVCACFWRDEAMVKYASDPSLDIHRDMAAECYGVRPEEVTKQARFFAKNCFVFPTLYGSYYRNTSSQLWTAMESNGLTDSEGVPLRDRLGEIKVTRKNYEGHVKEVEDRFQARFPQWTKDKDRWWGAYLKSGRFSIATGFTVEGVYSRNNLMNYPIQGPAFHILLWSLIRMVRWTLKRRTRVVGQIHDSIVADVHKDELEEYLAIAKRVMTEDVRKHWDWIVTPLEIEAEVAEDNWFNKRSIEL